MRLEAGVSQREFARRMGVSQSSLSHLEAGRQGPTLHQLLRCEQVLTGALLPDLGAEEVAHPIRAAGWLTVVSLQAVGALSAAGVRVHLRSLAPDEAPLAMGALDDELEAVVDGFW
jgi:transcriptional regulator with XRE-family HTH domain